MIGGQLLGRVRGLNLLLSAFRSEKDYCWTRLDEEVFMSPTSIDRDMAAELVIGVLLESPPTLPPAPMIALEVC